MLMTLILVTTLLGKDSVAVDHEVIERRVSPQQCATMAKRLRYDGRRYDCDRGVCYYVTVERRGLCI